MRAARFDLLQRMPVFGAMREDAQRLLLERAGTCETAAGSCFFRENEPADSMFVIETGRVAVVKASQGEAFVLRRLGPGDCFGEMALMDLAPRSATVLAEEDCRAIEIGSADLLHLFEHDPEQFALIQMNIGREVCRRLRALDELLFEERKGGTPLAAEILFRADRG